jgi:hypothetical protein
MLRLVPTDPAADTPPPARRGPHPLLALSAYASLIVVAMTVVLALLTCGRAVDRAV